MVCCCVEVLRKYAVVVGVNLTRGKVHADGCRIADGRCTTHLQGVDGSPYFALRFQVQICGFVRKFGLVDDDEGMFFVIEGEGFHF